MRYLRYLFSQPSIRQPVFIWGAPRSGTTLVYSSLTKHPHVRHPQTETGALREGTGLWWAAFGEQRGPITAEQVTRRRSAQVQRAYAALLPDDAHRLVDKMPFMTQWVAAVDRVFPDAYHIHIIRDGRAVVNSILYKLRHSQKPKDERFKQALLMYGPQPPDLENPLALHPAERHARQWVSLVQTGQAQQALLGERYYELRYETLVAHYRDQMRALFDYVGLTVTEAFLSAHYPPAAENRNYKRQIHADEAIDDGWTAYSAIQEEDRVYMQCMKPLLKVLGYDED